MSKKNFQAAVLASTFSILGFSFSSHASFAQNAIAPDNTLPVNTLVNFDSTTKTYTITGGTQARTNQFHSFQELSVPTSNTAHFDNALTTTNVIGRVTGSNVSNIDGLIKTNGATNLYLVNPNGITFGANAKLDIAGSFSASTANSIKFSDGSEFSATNPQAPPLLNVNVPLGLQYGNSNTGATISNRGNLSAGQDLVLNADKLDLQGALQAGRDLTLQAQDSVKIRDISTSPFAAVAGHDLLIQGNQSVDIFTLNNVNSGFWSGGNMLLISLNPVIGDAHFYAGGNFKIEQLNGGLGNLESPNDPIIRSAGDVTFGIYIGSSLHILAGGRVNINTIFITGADTTGNTINQTGTPTLSNVILSNGKTLTINGSTQPTVDIRAGMNPSDIGVSGIIGTDFFSCVFSSVNCFYNSSLSNYDFPSTSQSATGSGITIGDIKVNSPNGIVLLTNNYKPNLALPNEDIVITGAGSFGFQGIDTFSSIGNSGSVFVDSRSSIELNKNIFTLSSAASGIGGSVTLLSNNDIRIGDNAQIVTSSPYLGGQVDLKANGEISGRGIFIVGGSSASTIAGNSGDINITATSLSLKSSSTQGSIIFNSTLGSANAGNITLNISGSATFESSISNSPTQILSLVGQNATGTAGSIKKVNVGALNLQNNAQIVSRTEGFGIGGNIEVFASTVNIDGIGSAINNQVGSTANGNGGKISLNTGALTLTNQGSINSTTQGLGNSGDIEVLANTLNINGFGSAINNQVLSTATGNGGKISLNTGALALTNQGKINSTTQGLGNSGDIEILASIVNINGSAINNQVSNAANGNGGKLTLNADTLNVTNAGQISTLTSGNGNAGELRIITTGDIVFDRSTASSSINFSGVGKGGNLFISARTLQLLNGSQVGAGVFGIGDGGKITIQADTVTLSGKGAISGLTLPSAIATTVEESTAIGNAGNIDLSTRILSLSNGAFISAATNGQGNTGNIDINASESVSLSNSSIFNFINDTGNGKGGNLNIIAPSISLSNGSKISVKTFGIGNAGNLNLLTQSLSLSNSSALEALTDGIGNAGNITIAPIISNFTSNTVKIDGSLVSVGVNPNGKGNGGTLSIRANLLQILNGTQIQSGVFGKGNGGQIIISSDTIKLEGRGIVFGQDVLSGIFTSVDDNAIGNAGSLNLKTTNLDILNGAVISATTSGVGNAGKIEIQASDMISLNNGAIRSNVGITGQGDGGSLELFANKLRLANQSTLSASTASNNRGGSITVTANSLEIAGGSQLQTTTSSSGVAGNISLFLTNLLQIDGKDSGIFAGTSATSTGKSGTIFIDPELVTLTNGAKISVSSLGKGNGGNIELIAGLLSLNGGSQISAETASGEGGNITLRVRDLLWLRNGSLISATAGNDGNGGNIDLNANFILAFPKENSDIIANAFRGKGGNIKITTQAIFGLQFRPRLTPLSDITASSDFGVNGSVNINTPGVDPSKGLTNLPLDISDASKLVTQKCLADRQGSAFVITGRGGIPASPADVISGNKLQENLGMPTNQLANQVNQLISQPNRNPDRIVEAQGWIISDRGEISFIAEVPAIPATVWSSQPKCVSLSSR